MKTISFVVPCYNSQDYMAKCIDSILVCGDDIEVLIVDDGSTDDTAKIADQYEADHPGIVRAIHQKNAGHGGALNKGLENATGLYFKVVDSDDWLDEQAAHELMDYLRTQRDVPDPTDMVLVNYVYEKVYENKSQPMNYHGIVPVGEKITWAEVGHFDPSSYILMHSVVYRTQLLKDIGLKLPEHTFYVDNIFVYEPLPYVKSIFYLDVDLYRYFIGREGQSVQESTMMNRMDQQLRVTKIMIDAVDVESIPDKKLRKYMENYLAMMMCICSVFLRMKDTPEDDEALKGIWMYLKSVDPELYKRTRRKLINLGTNLPTEAGRKVGIGGYRLAQKVFNFN